VSNRKNRYSQIIEAVFFKYYRPGLDELAFARSDIAEAAERLGVAVPKNLGDVLYSFRYRANLPASVAQKAPAGHEWVIRPAGRARYKFALAAASRVVPSAMLAQTKIPDATPGVIEKYVLNDEQALLAKVRYNRLVDIFTSLACYSLQSHVRTSVPGLGQVETDEVYVGIDTRGAHYVLPVQAKGTSDTIGVVQIEQDLAVCATKFPDLICRPLAAQFLSNDVIALFEFESTEDGVAVVAEKHYTLVRPEELSPEELERYRRRPD